MVFYYFGGSLLHFLHSCLVEVFEAPSVFQDELINCVGRDEECPSLSVHVLVLKFDHVICPDLVIHPVAHCLLRLFQSLLPRWTQAQRDICPKEHRVVRPDMESTELPRREVKVPDRLESKYFNLLC